MGKRIAAAIADYPDLHWFISFLREKILKQTATSTARHASGQPLSMLDGVLFRANDSMHTQDHVTTCVTVCVALAVSETYKEAPVIVALRKLECPRVSRTCTRSHSASRVSTSSTTRQSIHGAATASYPRGSSSGPRSGRRIRALSTERR